MDRLPLPQNDPRRAQTEAARQAAAERVRVALTETIPAFRQAEPDDWPNLVVYLLRALDPLGLDLDAVQRILDDRLAWGDWGESDPETANGKDLS